MMNALKLLLLAAVTAVMASSCNVTRNLPKNETLLEGYKIDINADGIAKGAKGSLKSELSGLLRPKPNTNILGIRYKLWFYSLVDTPKKISVRGFLKKQFGEEPVLASSVNMEKNRLVLQNRLENNGYFHAAVTADSTTNQQKRMTTFRFTAVPGSQYKVRKLEFLEGDTSLLARYIDTAAEKTLLKTGVPYNLNVIRDERVRIDAYLKERGYYYFSPEYLIADVDSTVGDHEVDVFISIKETAPEWALQRYTINNVWVYADYSIEKDSALALAPSELHYGYNIIDPEHKFKPKIYPRTLVFEQGDIYSRRSHNLSLQRLVTLGTFRFVKARFEEVDTVGYFLDPYYFLTPLPKKNIRAEVTGLTRSNNATGGELSVSWRNRNAFGGAEQLSVTAFGGLEQQVSGNVNVSTIRYGLETALSLPRIFGFLQLAKHSQFVPRTRITAGFEFFTRNTQYTLTSIKGNYGFQWKTNIKNEHLLNILSVNYVEPTKISPQFQSYLDTNITLARSIQKQFILGPNYNYNYNSNAEANDRRYNWYFNFNIDVPGNLLGLISGSTFNKEKQGSNLLLNVPFSQYARVEIDGRNYMRLSRKNTTSILATRLIIGYGQPYGNSTQLPFIKQFFIGGANSIRAFRARSLGPGSYYVRNYQTTGFIPDQPGDMKLEGNVELRAKLISILHGAVFVDAGNIWTKNEDPERPGSKFGKDWVSQIAVGAGAGLRFDLSFLVLRLDVATPIRKPYVQNTALSNAASRRENIVFNIAIGYPF